MSIRKVLGNTRWKLLVGLAVFVGVLVALPAFRLTLLGWLGGEPCYRGRPVSYWRHELWDWRIGAEPHLETADEDRQQDSSEDSPEFLYVFDHPGKWWLTHRNTTTQQTYAWLRGLRDHRQGHGTCVSPTYGDPFCKLAILEGDPAAVRVLSALLKDEDIHIRRLAAATLGTTGPQAQAAFPVLLETSKCDDDAFLRGIARIALLDIDKEAAQKVGVVDHFIFWSPQPTLLCTIQGHFLLDSSMRFLAEGKVLVREDKDGMLTLRELATGKVLASFQGPTDSTPPIVFSRDSKTVASVSKDKMTVKVWNLATGKDLATLRGHVKPVESLAFSPDGKTLASGSHDKTVKLWSVSNGRNTATLRGHANSVGAVAFSPDGRTLASAGTFPDLGDYAVNLWDLDTGKERVTLQQGNWHGVSCLAFSPDGKTLASGRGDSAVTLVDVVSGKKRATLDDGDEAGSLESVAFSADGRILAYVSWDKIFLCDVAKGKNTAKILAEPGHVDAAVFSPDARLLAVTKGRDDGRETLWEFANVRVK
jgi:hypothetical protein